jgi:protein-tyrosine phosphatase
MPQILPWQRVDPREAARFAARLLNRGGLLAFPTDTTYALVAAARVPAAVERLRASTGAATLELLVGSVAAARDWLPDLGDPARRLLRRAWPGPLSARGAAGAGLATRLPADVRAVLGASTVTLRNPAHEAVLEVLRFAAAPLVAAPAGAAQHARQVLASAGASVDLLFDDGLTPGGQTTTVSVDAGGWAVLQSGALTEDELRRRTALAMVFVCTGNTCRSPLAEALCKRRLAQRLGCAVDELPVRGYHVASAGLAAGPGLPAALEAVEVARAAGADLTAHQSQPLTPDLAAAADYLLVMTAGHLQALADSFPTLQGCARLLDPDGDIADPIGGPLPVYQDCARQIDACLDALLAEVAP